MQSTENECIGEDTYADKQLSLATLFYLATAGGAEVCNLSHCIGTLQPKKHFDALVISVRPECGNPALWMREDDLMSVDAAKLEGFLERFLFCGDDRNILRVYVQGSLVGGSTFHA